MSRTLTVPLFPLPGIVLFPGVKVPFYVFEPRYRAMLAEALDGQGLLGIPMLRRGFESSTEGAPPIVPVFGVGSVENYVTRPDGTSHILVRGRWAVRLDAELAEVPVEGPPVSSYRRARVTTIDEAYTPDADRATLREAVRDLVGKLDPASVPDEDRRALAAFVDDPEKDLGPVVNLLCSMLVPHATLRQELLEIPAPLNRIRRLRALAPEPGGDSGPPEKDEDRS